MRGMLRAGPSWRLYAVVAVAFAIGFLAVFFGRADGATSAGYTYHSGVVSRVGPYAYGVANINNNGSGRTGLFHLQLIRGGTAMSNAYYYLPRPGDPTKQGGITFTCRFQGGAYWYIRSRPDPYNATPGSWDYGASRWVIC